MGLGEEIQKEVRMMKIKVKLFATLRKYAPQAPAGEQELEVAEGATASQVLEQLKIPQAQVALVFVNSTHQKMDRPLADGDELGIFPPIAGG